SRLAADPWLAEALVAVTGASRAFGTLLEADPSTLDVLADLDVLPPTPPAGFGDPEPIRRWKQREELRLAARDLLGVDGLEATVAGVAACARTVLDATVGMALDGLGVELAVIGMGKLGGNELNYASDIDVLFVG